MSVTSKTSKMSTPDQQASRSTCVITPEGEEVQVTFNTGTGEVTYQTPCCCTHKKNDNKPCKSETITPPVR